MSNVTIPPITFRIAGVQHRPQDVIHKAIREGLDVGVGLTLVGEPSNSFDRYAVKVLYKDNFIGYVPKPVNGQIWQVRNSGFKPTSTLIIYNPDAPTYEMFEVKVTFSPSHV
tara:strand:+ start:635 stop:970 length:336 start_codon:yes stop_codon:yes gene_type:complete